MQLQVKAMLFNEKILKISKKKKKRKKENGLQRTPFPMAIYKIFMRYRTTRARRIILEISMNIQNANKNIGILIIQTLVR